MKRKSVIILASMIMGVSLIGCKISSPKMNDSNKTSERIEKRENKKEENKTNKEFYCEKIIGQIIKVDKDDYENKVYIQLDRVDFYFGQEIAYKEYVKDCLKEEKKACDKNEFYMEYYIRNEEYKLIRYSLDENVKYYLSDYNNPVNASIGKEVKYDEFIGHINKYIKMSNGKIVNRANMFWVSFENGKIVEIRHQYTP